jgi:glycosyltransferase involved in cell wall biosynthesis
VVAAFEDTDLACGPTIVLDALALGIPIVVTDTNACRDYYIAHGQTGLLSDPTSPEALSYVQMLMNGRERGLRMGSRAREYAVGELNQSLFEEGVVDALHSIGAD